MSNTHGAIGHNVDAPRDYSKEEVERLSKDYAEHIRTAEGLIEEAANFHSIENDDDKKACADIIKRTRDFGKRLDGLHELEKNPHLRRGQGVDQFFFGMIGRLFKRQRRDNDGSGDVLQNMLTAYDNKKLAEEQERRRLEAQRLQREEDERKRIAAEEARKAEEARLAAERARNPERKEEKAAIADKAEQAASSAAVEVAVAEGKAEEAHIATLAKPADIMRSRDQNTGTMSTVRREAYAEVEDQAKLDKEALWAFVPFEAKEKALKAWAKSTGHNQQMDGARIGFRNKSVVR